MALRKDGPRPAVIGTCSLANRSAADAGGLLADRLAMVDQMAREAELKKWKLDIVVVPEFSPPATVTTAEEGAEPMDGPTVTAMAKKAVQHHTYVAAPVHLRQDDRVFNSVVMINRSGKPIGAYHKVFPVMMSDGSLERDITPGSEFPVFDLDFGRVGVQICWDSAFPEGWQALGDQEAELVLYPTFPICMVVARSYAWWHGYYVAGAVHRMPAAVIGPTGHVIATTTSDREVLVVRVDLDYEVLNTNCLWEWPEAKRREYAERIKLEWHEDEYLYLVTSLDPKLPVRRFLQIEGLLTGRQRRARNLDLLADARGGPPQRPKGLGRHA